MKSVACTCAILFGLLMPNANAQGMPTIENNVANLIRKGEYTTAIQLLENNFDLYQKDPEGHSEIFNWLASLYYAHNQWDRFIALYNNHVWEAGEDSTLLSAARLYRQYQQHINVVSSEWTTYSTGLGAQTPRIKVKINGKKYRFWVDTGAGLSVVTDKVARKCGLKQYVPGNATATTATGNAVSISFAVIDSLKGAGLDVKNHPCLVLRKNDLKFKILGITVVKINGIIGWNLLQELAVDIDFKEEKIRFALPQNTPVKDPNFFWMDVPTVNTTSEKNENTDFFIDTGASESGLYADILNKVDTSKAIRKKITLGSAGGTKTIDTYVLPEVKLKIGDQVLTLVNTAVHPELHNNSTFLRYGVIGTRELNNFLLHFSLKEGEFRLIPR